MEQEHAWDGTIHAIVYIIGVVLATPTHGMVYAYVNTWNGSCNFITWDGIHATFNACLHAREREALSSEAVSRIQL